MTEYDDTSYYQWDIMAVVSSTDNEMKAMAMVPKRYTYYDIGQMANVLCMQIINSTNTAQ